MSDPNRVFPILPPPYIFCGALLISLGINIVFPWPLFSIEFFIIRIVSSVILLAAGFMLVFWAFKTLQSRGVDPRFKPVGNVVSHGPFGFTRNPMYVSFTLFYLGLTLLFNAAWPLLFFLIIFPTLHYGVIKREEAYMKKNFGDEYLNYKAKVRRWL